MKKGKGKYFAHFVGVSIKKVNIVLFLVTIVQDF